MPNHTLPFILIICWTVSAFSAGSDPFVGKWKLNSSQTTLADQMTIQAIGGNKYTLTFSGSGDSETVAADGTDQPGVYGSMVSVTVEEPDTWKIVRKKDGRVLLTALWKLSKDGKTLTDAFTGNRADGSSSTVNMVYRRAAGDSGIPGTWETTDARLDAAYKLEIRPYDADGLSFIFPDSPSPRNVKFDDKEHVDASLGVAFLGHRIDEHTLEFTSKVQGKILKTRHMTVSPDLKRLTIVEHVMNQRLPNTLVFDRE